MPLSCRSKLELGVRTSDGDGTVPLLSLGTMCRKHWRENSLNPAELPVVTREYKHEVAETATSAVAAFNYMNPRHQYEKLRRFKRHDLCVRNRFYIQKGQIKRLTHCIDAHANPVWPLYNCNT